MAKRQDPDEVRDLKFKYGNPVVARVHPTPQVSPAGKTYRLELSVSDGPAQFTYEEFVRFAQSVMVLMRPSVLLED